jgi:hypothetical protein
MVQPVVPVTPQGGAIMPAELVRQNIATVLAQCPDLISYDPTTDEGEMLSLRCAVDPGVEQQKRDGYRGTVVNWGVSAYECKGDRDGEIVTVPSIALVMESGDIVRLTGWPGIKAWAALVRAAGKERCQLGMRVVIKRRASSTAGRSYWTVLPDA